jgi:hypothetical protein
VENTREKVIYFVGGIVLASVVIGLLLDAKIDVFKYWLEFFTAIGTVGSVMVALYFSFGSDKREKLRIADEKRVAHTILLEQLLRARLLSQKLISAFEEGTDNGEKKFISYRGLDSLVEEMEPVLSNNDIVPHFKYLDHDQLTSILALRNTFRIFKTEIIKIQNNGEIGPAVIGLREFDYAKKTHRHAEQALSNFDYELV